MSSPSDLKYTDSHEWARQDDDLVVIGITQHAADSLSDLVFLELPEVGDSVTAGEGFGEIESVKAVSDLKSPVDGEVVEVNEGLVDELGAINSDPYGEGWMIKVRSTSELDGLMASADYDKLVAEDS